ncbi:hypothetical protein BC830DRAFT_600763 [Chytriomyces sp. MP71]|nr:hypothetical protein BC830DRAFT_600763 [Chytriomyces sp. MP71]
MMTDIQRSKCGNCTCEVFQIQSSSKRCKGCGHGAVFHEVVEQKVKQQGSEYFALLLTRAANMNNMAGTNWTKKLNDAKADKDLSDAVSRGVRSVVIWISVTLIGFYVVATGMKQPKVDRGYAVDAYVYTAVCFFIAFVYSFIGSQNAQNNEKKQLAQVLMCVNFIAMATFIVQALDLSPTHIDVAGNPFDVARILDWVSNCPTLIHLIADVTHNHHMAAQTARLDYLLLALGFMSTLFRQPYAMGLALAAVMTFTFLVNNLNSMFLRAIDEIQDSQLQARRDYVLCG